MNVHKPDNRRTFLKKASGLLAGMGVINQTFANPAAAPKLNVPKKMPDNPLVLFDNFHVGNRRSYSFKARFAAAQNAGFDGFELVGLAPDSDAWKEALDLIPTTHFTVWGLHRTSKAVIDENADRINADIEQLYEIAEACAKTPIEYITLSLSGTSELQGPTIDQSGSARAQERHWERAYKIIAAFDDACRKNNIRGSLYPHTHWICDTPQSVEKIMKGANATHIGPAFCSHHWYANKASVELDEALAYPVMKRLNYVVLTNGRFSGNRFPAIRFDRGEIDMAWLLAKIYEFGYDGPISSQGWAIGGDPYVSCKTFVEGIQSLRKRFKTQPELWPLQ